MVRKVVSEMATVQWWMRVLGDWGPDCHSLAPVGRNSLEVPLRKEPSPPRTYTPCGRLATVEPTLFSFMLPIAPLSQLSSPELSTQHLLLKANVSKLMPPHVATCPD